MKKKSKFLSALTICCSFILLLEITAWASTQVIHVPQDITDLQQAIDASDKDATIRVSAGIYYGNFKISGNRNLIGEDPQTTILTDDGEGPPDAIITIAGDCTFSGFTVTGARGAGLGHAVIITRGSPRITNNIIRDNSFTGLGIHTEIQPTLAIITGNKIYGNGGAGIANYGQHSKSLIEHNEVYSNINVGIVSIYFASPIIRENNIHHNGVGIVVRDDAQAVITKNNITANQLVGINVTTNSAARITNNSSTNNGTVGINIDRQSRVEIFKNTVMDNGAEAIYFKGKSEGVIDSNAFAGNLPTIAHFDKSRVRISNNSFYSTESPANNAVLLSNAKALVGNNEVAGGIKVDNSELVELSKEQMVYSLKQEPFWNSEEGLPLDPLPPLDPPPPDPEAEENPEPVSPESKSGQEPRLKSCWGIL
jgi:parallel beta-helix repeat protein